ncbi:MAG: hypothetical protein R3256_10365 [Thalassovita sp.]|nr:hypothetical protein [Thalassovita sp.]
MSGLITLFLSFSLLAMTCQPALPATSNAAKDQLHIFATCTGRLSAQMEYQWMFDGEGSEGTETARDALVEILDAIMRPDQRPDVMAWRVEAKMAQSALLARAVFNLDRRDAQMAQRIARRRVEECRGLLLG